MDNQKKNLLSLSQQLVSDLDKLLETGNWEESLFLRTMAKQITSIRDEAKEIEEKLSDIGTSTSAASTTTQNIKSYQLPEGFIKAYIYLYQAEGNNLVIWQNMLKSLEKYSINRPIYIQENHIQELIRSKSDQIRHGYAIIAVKKEDLLPSESQKTDAQGHELFILKEHAIDPKNIIMFVHGNKKNYTFHNNKLHLQNIIS